MFDQGLLIFHQKSNVDFQGQLLLIYKSEFDNFGLFGYLESQCLTFDTVFSFLLTYKLQDLDFI